MYLKKVTLRNFRCFEQFEIDLHPQLTVLVGLNGAGKTAILDGIAAGLSPVLRYLSSANQRLSAAGAGIRDTDFRLVPSGKKSGRERWGASDYAQIVIETTDGLRWDEWRASAKKQGVTPPEKVGHKSLASRLSEIQESFKSEARELLPVFAYYGAQRGSIEIPQRLRGAKENYEHPTSALVDSLDPRSDFREMLAWFEQEEASELRKNKGKQSDDWQPSPTLDGVREAIQLLLNEGYENPHFNEFHRFVVESKTTQTPFQVSQLSQGYQAMLALGMDFARRLSLGNEHLAVAMQHIGDLLNSVAGNDPVGALLGHLQKLGRPVDGIATGIATKFAPAVMLVDEIDLHLHPAWQQRVLADLMRAFPGTQFIVTTHSPQVLTSADSSCIRVVQEEPDTESGKRRFVVKSGFQQTKGVASSDLLAKIMGVNPIPPVEEAQWVADYTAMIENGVHESVEGKLLREKLVKFYGGTHPILLDADRLIRFQNFKLRRDSAG